MGDLNFSDYLKKFFKSGYRTRAIDRASEKFLINTDEVYTIYVGLLKELIKLEELDPMTKSLLASALYRLIDHDTKGIDIGAWFDYYKQKAPLLGALLLTIYCVFWLKGYLSQDDPLPTQY